MLKRLFIILTILSVLALLVLPSSASGTITLSGYDNIISWTLYEDPDDGFEDVTVLFSAYGSTSWTPLETFTDLSITSYIIPASLWKQGNRFRVSASSPDSTSYSNIYSMTRSAFEDFSLEYDLDNFCFRVSPSPSSIVLHFTPDTYDPDDISSPQPFTVTIPAQTSVYYYTYALYKDYLGRLREREYNSTVYATTVLDGVTYQSNEVYMIGTPYLAPYTADTSIYTPLVNDVTPFIDLTYSGVFRTPVYKYAFSALFAVVPLLLCGFVVKKFIL